MSYTLFYAPGAASLAVHWMLIEVGVDFCAKRLDLAAGEQRLPDYLQLNPAGRVPTLIIDGVPHSEAAALLMLLAERHQEANLAPPHGDILRGRWFETMIYLSNTVSPAMRDWFYAEKDGDPSDAPSAKRLALTRIEGAWERLDAILSDGRLHLLGQQLTAADFFATMFMRWSRNMPRPATSWRHIAPYVSRMRARESFRDMCRREGLRDWLNS